MSKRNKEWARKARKNLQGELGGECAWCGSVDELTFDCINPRGDSHHRKDTSARMCFYRAQFAEKNLQILCAHCNTKKSIIEATWREVSRLEDDNHIAEALNEIARIILRGFKREVRK